MPAQRRLAPISASQRKALRQYAKANPLLTQKQLQAWFETEFQRLLTQPTISESLSNKFNYLDEAQSETLDSQQRNRPPQWPVLETALFQWCQEIELEGGLTGDIIKQQAIRFWQRLAPYQGMEVPVFSNGWLQGFKQRHDIRLRKRHGEAASVDIHAIEEQLIAVKAIASQFAPSDCYNCDETGLFYKMMPDQSLSTRQLPGHKVEKNRISIHFCCNADGSDKLPPWFIGKHARPRCFGSANIHLSAFNCVWRHNSKAWMTADIMVEWLQWFAKRVEGRRVLLLMDNFSAHTKALDIVRAYTPLQNVTIAWLPPNSTSKTQPLDQGIIHTFKTYYRRSWLSYVLDELELHRLPLKTMNVLKAIRWSIQAWQAVKPDSIQNCWYHSGLIERPQAIQVAYIDLDTPRSEVQAYITKLQHQQRISTAMAIESFLNPAEEAIQDSPEEITEAIAQFFDPLPESDSEEEEVLPKVSYNSAIQALQQLRLFEMQQEDGQHEFVDVLDRHEACIKQRQASTRRQTTINSYFT